MRRFLLLILCLLLVAAAVTVFSKSANRIGSALFGSSAVVARAKIDIAPMTPLGTSNVEVVSIEKSKLKPGMITNATGEPEAAFAAGFTGRIVVQRVAKGAVLSLGDFASGTASMKNVDVLALRVDGEAGKPVLAEMLETRTRNRDEIPFDSVVLPAGETLAHFLSRMKSTVLASPIRAHEPLTYGMLSASMVSGEDENVRPLVPGEDIASMAPNVFGPRLRATKNAVEFKLEEAIDAALSGKEKIDLYLGVAGAGEDAGIETYRLVARNVGLRVYYSNRETTDGGNQQSWAAPEDGLPVRYFAFVDGRTAENIRVKKAAGAALLVTPSGYALPAATGESTLCSGSVCYRTVRPKAVANATAPAPSAQTDGPDRQAKACEIKGYTNGLNRKVYVMPGSAVYAATNVETAKDGRWFCSEAEARAAGFGKVQ